MITLQNEEEMMVWLFAMNGYQRTDLDTKYAADWADRMVEEYRKRRSASKQETVNGFE